MNHHFEAIERDSHIIYQNKNEKNVFFVFLLGSEPILTIYISASAATTIKKFLHQTKTKYK